MNLRKMSYAVLALMSVGVYGYHTINPWKLVPLSVLTLGVAWWLLITFDFKSAHTVEKVYYVPTILILSIFIWSTPSMAIILRTHMQQIQVLNLTFFSMAIFVLTTGGYYLCIGKWKR